MQRNLSRLVVQFGTLLCVAGFVVMFLGWNGAATYTFTPAQIPYLISGGIGGLGLIIIGATILILQHLRTERAHIEAAINRLAATGSRDNPGIPNVAGTDTETFVIAGTDSYHRVGCTLPEGSDQAYLSKLDKAASQGLSPCRVCHPPESSAHVAPHAAAATQPLPRPSHAGDR